jgi:hypothetical protein
MDNQSFVFVSYDHDDSDVVFPIIESVSASGYALWYDKGINISSTWTDEIALAIMKCKIFVVFISKNSVESSYVRSEIEFALNNKIKIIPVYLDGLEILPPGLALGLNTTQGITDVGSQDEIAAHICDALAYNDVAKLDTADSPLAKSAEHADAVRPGLPKYPLTAVVVVLLVAVAVFSGGFFLRSPRDATEDLAPREEGSVEAVLRNTEMDRNPDITRQVTRVSGLIDWTGNSVEATGIAFAPKGTEGARARELARRGAIADMQRNLLEFIVGVNVSSSTTMNDFMVGNDKVRSEVQGVIKNVEVLDGAWDGESFTVSGRVRLSRLLSIVYPASVENGASGGRSNAIYNSAAPDGSAYTGLIIDARHLPIVPALSFRVVDEEGRAVYGVNFADPAFAVQYGLAVYRNSLERAREESRVAANPIVTEAVRLVFDSGDIVIPNAAASMINGGSYDFRRECKVVIVMR